MNPSRHFYAVVSMVALLSALGLGTGRAGKSAAASNPLNVFVTNSAAAPVPTKAQGTTQIAGTVVLDANASVAINGTPTVNLANGTSVGITGTPNVNVVNTRTPICQNDFLDSPDGNQFGDQGQGVAYVVPVGKKLTIKDVSGTASLPSGERIVQFLLFKTSSSPEIAGMTFEFQGVNQGLDYESAHISTDIQFDAGDAVRMTFRRSTTGGRAFAFVSWSGYLEDAP